MLWAIVLMIVGIGFIICEVFFPSLGLFGLIAGGCIIGADYIAFQTGGQLWGWILISLQVVLIPITLRFAFRTLPKLPFGKRMMLEPSGDDDAAGAPDHRPLVGIEGVAATDLRPSGRARFHERQISVVSEGATIPAGTTIVVTQVDGPEVRVRAHTPDPQEPSA